MAIKWPPEVPAFPPSCSQPLAFYSPSSQQPECHSSALNLPMAPTTLRGKAQVIPVPFCNLAPLSLWPHLLSLFPAHPAPSLFARQTKLAPLSGSFHLWTCLESSFPRSIRGLPFTFLPVSVQLYLIKADFPNCPIYNVHTHRHSLFPSPPFIFFIELTIIWNVGIFHLVSISLPWKINNLILSHSLTVLSPEPRLVLTLAVHSISICWQKS